MSSQLVTIDKKERQSFQSNSKQDILQKLQTTNKVICVAPTGVGKTYGIIQGLIKDLVGNIVVLVNSIQLKQKYQQLHLPIVVKTYQSNLNLNLEEPNIYKDCDYVICDECHHITKNNSWGKCLNKILNKYNIKCIGLTATENRQDGINVVTDFFDGQQVQPLYLQQAIERNILPEVTHVIGVAQLDLDVKERLNSKLSELDRYSLDKLLNIPELLKTYITGERLNNLKIVVFVSRTDYLNSASQLCENWFLKAFPNKHINSYFISYKNTKIQNKKVIKEFEQNHDDEQIDLLFNVDIAKEGMHINRVHTVLMLCHTKSSNKFLQQVGRAINPIHDDLYIKPLILDIFDNIHRLYTKPYKDYIAEIESGNMGYKPKIMLAGSVVVKGKEVPFSDYMNQELKKALNINLTRLTDTEKHIIRTYYLQGMSVTNISRKMNKHLNTIINCLKSLNIYKSKNNQKVFTQQEIDYLIKNCKQYSKNYWQNYFKVDSRRMDRLKDEYNLEFAKGCHTITPECEKILQLQKEGIDFSQLYINDICPLVGIDLLDLDGKRKITTFLNSRKIIYRRECIRKFENYLKIKKYKKQYKNCKTSQIAKYMEMSMPAVRHILKLKNLYTEKQIKEIVKRGYIKEE